MAGFVRALPTKAQQEAQALVPKDDNRRNDPPRRSCQRQVLRECHSLDSLPPSEPLEWLHDFETDEARLRNVLHVQRISERTLRWRADQRRRHENASQGRTWSV